MTAVCFSRFSSNFLKKTFSRSIHLKYISSKVVCREDTIFALSSGHGKAGVAVIRVSGPAARDAILRLSAVNKLPPPQQATIRNIVDPNTQEPIDRGLVLWFPGPRSFTGEDTAELHIHGGIAVVTALLTALGKLPGLRHAEAGEFTKRAFINGKLDLTEVEGLADLVNAETEAQRKQALRQLSGELSKLYTDWRHRLIKCLANVEAFIDFHEEENIEDDVLDHVEVEIKNLLSEISAHLGDGRRGERLRSGIHVVIIGPPNVGKSSLLNRLCQRPAAIVSPTAGTTRDVIETAINLAGFPVLISDTAGLREAEGDVEREGIKRAMSRALNSDIKVIMLDAPAILTKHENKKSDLQELVISHLSELGFLVELIDEQNTVVAATDTEKSENQNKKLLDKNHNMYPPHHIDDIQKKPILPANRRSHSKHENCFKQVSYDDLKMETVRSPFQNLDKSADIQNSETGNEADKISLKADDIIIVFNKCDLLKDFRETEERTNGFEVMWVSCITQEGIPQFVDVLTEKVKQMCWDPLTGDVNLTQTRHRSHLTHCVRHLQSYQLLLDSDIVIASQQLRKAVREIGKVIGKVSSEDILNVIFSDFCIGK